MRKYLSDDEILKISNSLENYHKIFYTFFELSAIAFDDSIQTAAIWFIKDQKPLMTINEEFWNSKTDIEKHFIICHECLHVLLRHGIRNGKHIKGATHRLVNMAQDITINEMIVYMFGFDRNDLSGWEQFCWIDTCFKNPVLIKRNETFLYYLELLIQQDKEDPDFNSSNDLVDQHNDSDQGGDNDESGIDSKAASDLAKKIANELSAEELEEIMNNLEGTEGLPGSSGGMFSRILEQKTKNIKINFKQIVNKLKKSRLKKFDKDIETFVKDDRRYSSVLNDNRDIVLPSRSLEERPKLDKLLVYIFMDVSGSCIQYLPTFERIINAFKAEDKLFDVVFYTFDSVVNKIDTTKYVFGGGTEFGIIETEVLKSEKYPDGVIIITDGEGTKVEPKYPNRWIWMLTSNNTELYIPEKSKVYKLNKVDFE